MFTLSFAAQLLLFKIAVAVFVCLAVFVLFWWIVRFAERGWSPWRVLATLTMLTALAVFVVVVGCWPALAQSSGPSIVSIVPADTVSLGTLAGQVLMWITAAFVTAVGSVATVWIKRLATKAGVEVTQQMSDQLDRTLVNGLNDAATRVSAAMQGRGNIAVKDDIVKGAIAYAQAHRAETIQALGLDPQSGTAVAALRARIATLAQDPMVPTPAVLTPPAAPAA